MGVVKDTLVVNVISFTSILNPIADVKHSVHYIKIIIHCVFFTACVNFDDIRYTVHVLYVSVA